MSAAVPLRQLEIAECPVPGVNLVGHLDAEFGLGEAARLLARTLKRAGTPLSLVNYGQTPVRREHEFELAFANAAPYDVNVLCLQPDQLAGFATHVGPQFFANRSSIGLWFWDSTVLPPELHPAFEFLDCVWVLSEFARTAIADAADAAGMRVPVRVVPVAVDERSPPRAARSDLGLPPGFVFTTLFDFVSFERKNPLGVVRAFERAFEPGEDVALHLKSINGRERKPRHLAHLQSVVEKSARPITFVDGHVTAEERDALLASADCLVSLHRAEGFGLPMMEAILCGTPVIATNYSGNTQFMDAESSYLVPFDLVPVPETVWGWTPGAMWAEPNVEAAAALMRQVFADNDDARKRAVAAKRRLFAQYQPNDAARALRDELTDVREDRGRRSEEAELQRARVLEALAPQEVQRRSARGLAAAVRGAIRRATSCVPGARRS